VILEISWRFDSPGPMLPEAVRDFDALIDKIAAQEKHWAILEHFKRYFAGASGGTARRSSSESWAESDLSEMMGQAAKNAPLSIEAFYEGCEVLRTQGGLAVPEPTTLAHSRTALPAHSP
jgi:hypothetical protein